MKCKLSLHFIYFYFQLHWVSVAACGLSLVAASRGYSSLQCTGFSLRWLLLLRSTGSRRVGFSSCGTWARQFWLSGSRAQAQQLWRTGLGAPWHVGSSRTRARTRVPCTGRQILNHCTTREVPSLHLKTKQFILKVGWLLPGLFSLFLCQGKHFGGKGWKALL